MKKICIPYSDPPNRDKSHFCQLVG